MTIIIWESLEELKKYPKGGVGLIPLPFKGEETKSVKVEVSEYD